MTRPLPLILAAACLAAAAGAVTIDSSAYQHRLGLPIPADGAADEMYALRLPDSLFAVTQDSLADVRIVDPMPADASAPRMKLTGPDAVPPEFFKISLEERMRERLRPAPEPPLKISPSSRYQLRIESMVSSTARMKQALTCCGAGVPTLNQTGLLKLKTWCSSIQVSSCSKVSASASVRK